MKIVTETVEGVAIITIIDKIMIGEGDDALCEAVGQVLKQDVVRGIVLDLAGAPYVDAAGLSEIVRSYTAASKSGRRLVLLHPTQKISDLLARTKLLTVFETYDTLEAALASFV